MSRLSAAATVLTLVAASCAKQAVLNTEADRVEVERALRRWPVVLQAYDYDGVVALIDSSTVWIEHSPPTPIATAIAIFRTLDSADVVIRYGELRNLQITVHGDVAWAHWLVDGTFTTDTDAGRAWFRSFTGTTDVRQREWRFNWVESAVMRRSNGQWRFAFGHTTRLPASPT